MKLKGLNIIHNFCLIELDIFWWKLKRKVVKINIFTFLQMSGARRLFIWNKGYNFTRHHTIKAYQAFISPILPWTVRWWWVSREHLYQEMVLLGFPKNFNNDCSQFKWKPFQKIWESVLIQRKVDTPDKINSEDLFNRKSD